MRYVPHVLNPPQAERQYRDRALDSPGLAEFVRVQTGNAGTIWPPRSLDLDSLTLIAYYYNAEIEVARARVNTVRAAGITARQRINPSLSGDAGYSRNPESALTYGAVPSFTIETAGKRGYRSLQSQKLAEAALLELAEAGWSVRSRVRAALVSHLFARHRLNLLRKELAIRTEAVEIFEKRFAVGEEGRPALDLVQAERIATEVAIEVATGEASQTLTVLATAVGLPANVLEAVRIEMSRLEVPPREEDLPIKKVQRAGLLHRADVRRTLAQYAASDALLRLEVANQYPNIQLSPSYAFQEGFVDYTLGIGLSALPIFHRNQGLIAEAEAQRKQVESQFLALQSRAIGEMDQALRQYRSALREWAKAEGSFLKIQKEREAESRAAKNAGEGDRLGVVAAQVLTIAAERSRLDALQRAQTAFSALEDAVQNSLEQDGSVAAPSLASPRLEAKP